MKNNPIKNIYSRIQESSNAAIIDVRDQSEHHITHISGAINIPLESLEDSIETLKEYDDIFIHCNTGILSSEACSLLQEAGLNHVTDIPGGLDAWRREGLPTTKKGHGISITRQVMLVAGTLVLLGILLGFLLSPYLYILSAFVGAGLLFAGISGTCMMAKLLAYMPWNKYK